MNNHNILIVTLIVLIVGIQVGVFVYALVKIRQYKRMFPPGGGFKINQVSLQPDMLAVVSPEEALITRDVYQDLKLEVYSLESEDEEEQDNDEGDYGENDQTIRLFEDDDYLDGDEEEKIK